MYDEQVRSEKITPITFWIASGDYTKKMGKNTDLQGGFKFTRSGFTNDILIARLFQDTWVSDPSYSANYELKENISAAYISLITNLDARTNIKLGLRYEYTNSNLGTADTKNIVDRHYGKLFPSFFISRKINDDNIINLSYSRRITRPGFGDLAPFTVFFDPNSLTTGNPALQASTADAVNAAYSYKNYMLSLSYSEEADAIAKFQTSIDPATNRQISSPENIRRLKIAALTFSIPLNLTRWWSMQSNLAGRWQQASSVYKGTDITLEQKNFRITCTQSFKLPKDFAIDISGFYQSGELRGRAFIRPLRALDFGIQKKIDKGKGKLSFAITDIFSSITYRGYVDIPEQNLVARRNMQFTQRIFKLTYSRSFGNSKLEGKRSKTDSSEEERKRVE
ncbi:MAG TPA: outer membrane beta-barrel family protein [Chryseolinea sp.]|nr:outer membrane beta-barrel family protein [Chryseolinea sp.]